ncbi:MAG: 1-deoxy-D-xylulose-5-phosphate reductoisomerase [Bacteroidota bacterium]|nr:1-deoxy-D-xylulose-5-phosphate reductoisomerase [Bacteroidota bacterium]
MPKKINICILGSTGSIGKSSLEVIANFPNRFRVVCLSAHKNTELLSHQVERFKPKVVALHDHHAGIDLENTMNGKLKVFSGENGIIELIKQPDIDIVINSLVGFSGLQPTIEAIKLGKTIALANKETLVVAGEIITKLSKKYNARIVPIDSEHSALLQCLAGENPKNIAKLILTASGGPFLNLKKNEFSRVSVKAALNHPNWKMGKKITIDSATLMNKGLEVIEAHWLFNLPTNKIEVLIHPQSIIHSMVEFVDGSIKAQLGMPDMRIPIQYALTYPNRSASQYRRVDFPVLKEMTFSKPDLKKFECLQLAYDAIEMGGTAPAILNAANEVAVDLFLNNKIKFNLIPKLIRGALKQIPIKTSPRLNDIIEVVKETRIVVNDMSKFIR